MTIRFPRAAIAALFLCLLLWSLSASAGPGLNALLAAKIPADERIRAVAMLDAPPTATEVNALSGLGLQVQGLKHLPMALTKGTLSQLRQAVDGGLAKDVYIDRRLHWHSAESTAAMSADKTRELGFDGSGIGIAVVDSGIDASHPDLQNRVVRNVRVYSPEYLDILGISEPTGISWPGEPALVLPFDALPYNNTDTIGHGTHVAGIVAGEGVGDGSLVGVAPGADIVGYSTGEILFIFTALASFDDILDTHEDYNIRVVNNSWGSSYRIFDPNDPITVGTKALHDAGITVVFSAGNDGVEMTTNVHSMAPWVIMSGSATTSAEKSDFSSSGLKFDNARVVEIGEDGHVRHEGDGLGLSHPDVSAPGSNIVSTCTPTGAIVCGATPPGGSSSASGTSMSAPHMAGLAALLLQAKPDLSPEEIRQVMQVTAVPMKDGAPLWRSGFGFVDALRAVQFVQRPDFGAELLNRLEAEQEAAALAARDHQVVAQDQWEFAELLFTAEGLETHEFPFEVLPQTQAIRASIAFPADLGLVGLNLLFEWSLNLLDPAGNVVASTELLPDIGIGVLHADFEELGLEDTAGTWTVEAVGDMHLAQPALLWGHTVTVAATQLEKQFTVAPVEPVFEASGSLDFVLSGGGGDFPSPEGCAYAPDGASGTLSTGAADSDCRSGTVGYLLNYGLSQPAEFVSEALPAPATVGGDALLSLYLADTPQAVYGVLFGSALTYQLDAIDSEGTLISAVASGEVPSSSLAVGPTPAHGIYPLPVPTTELPANARLRLRMQFSGVYTSTMRLLWGGEYGDAGLSLQTGALVQPRNEDTPPRVQPTTVGGSLGGWALLLLLLGWPRQRRH